MPIETNLNKSPYWDDFDEENRYHRVLFRPGVALQARELTQLQTILQNQIERFGDNVYIKGTIIDGCSISPDYNYDYIKIKDLQEDGQPVSLTSYNEQLLIQESYGLEARVINYSTGLESQDPDLNTLYIKYTNTGTGGEKTFSNNQVIKVFNVDRTVETISVVAKGSLYSNSDVVVFTSDSGEGATASITTNSDGEIISAAMINNGTGYLTSPTVTITTSTGAGGILSAVNYIAQIRVADSTFTDPVGKGSAVTTKEGVIYQKGAFIKVAPQTTILQKYLQKPDDKAVGFYTSEAVVTYRTASDLLDNAAGAPNFAAPGADRLKLTPVLTVLSKAEAAANNDFLPIIEFENGNIVRDRTVTQFNSINRELSRRTFEESGNYVLDTIGLDTTTIDGNTTHFSVVVSPGTSYVNGERVSLLNNSRVPVRKGTDTANNVAQTINTQYGSYVYIKEMLGAFEIKNGTSINLRSDAATDITDNAGGSPSAPGTVLGTALIRSMEYVSGTPGTPDAVYKLYLFNIKLNPGRTFASVRSVGINSTAIADVVLSNGKAVLNDIMNDKLVFQTGTFAVKELNAEEFSFRTSTTGTLTTGGSVTLSFSGSNTLPYGVGSLSDSQKQEFIIIPQTVFKNSSNNAGTVAATSGQANIVGTSTAFLTDYIVGDYITVGSNSPARIASISNNTLLALSSTASFSAVANAHYLGYPANVPINFNRTGRSITVNSDTSLTVDVGAGIDTTVTFDMYHDLFNYEPSVRTKTVNNPVYVKLSTAVVSANTNGPWCLGIPDVYEVIAVYTGTSNAYSEDTTNYANEFDLISGMKDNYYGLSYLTKKPGSQLTIDSTTCLVAVVKSFTHSTGKYLSTESYPIDDATETLPSNKIRTENIPVYVSPSTGLAVSLRDAIDFRPIVQPTATLATILADASIDPATTEAFYSGEKFFPSPSRSFQATIQSYLSRIDRLVMMPSGKLRVIEGVPSNTPTAPSTEAGSMELGLINVAPYPSLTSRQASIARRSDIKNTISLTQTRRYTMKDISSIENRVQRLEYYASLNTLENDTKNLLIPSEANSAIERFKNGFFVDSFNNYNISNINDGEYKAFVDTQQSVLMPQIDMVPVDLKYSATNSNTTKSGDISVIPYTNTLLTSQPYANKERSLVTGYWSFLGKMVVVPKVDNFFDTQAVGTSSININLYDPVNALVDTLNDTLGKVNITPNAIQTTAGDINTTTTTTSSFASSSSTSRPVTGGSATSSASASTTQTIKNYSQSITTTGTVTTSQITSPPAVTSVQQVGSFLKSVQVNPYIREQKIGVFVSGLRPGAQHYAFFDGVDVTASCVPATVTNPSTADISAFKETYNKGSSPGLFADSTGSLAYVFYLPKSTFTTGSKDMMVMDVSSLASESSATSKSVGKFSSFTLAGQSTQVNVNTKDFDLAAGDFSIKTFTETQVLNVTTNKWSSSDTVSSSATATAATVPVPVPVPVYIPVPVPPPPPPAPVDPLAQTFYIHPQDDSEYVMLTAIDIFFKAKDSAKGVTLELRSVSEDGYVTPFIYPFGSVYKTSSEVSISATAATATTFTFPSPIMVKAGREVAFVLVPDGNSPDYRVWTSVPGIADVTDTTVTSNKTWGEGTMFYSTSNRAFTSVQDEDVKFKAYRYTASYSSAVVGLTNDDTEYLTINSTTGTFIGGETVGQMSNTYLEPTITTNTTSTIIQTSASLASTLSASDKIMIIYGVNDTTGPATVKSSGTTLSNATASNTGFSTYFSNGEFIRIGNAVRQVISVANDYSLTLDSALPTSAANATFYTVSAPIEVLTIQSANSTAIIVDRPPLRTVNTTTAASLQKIVGGVVGTYNPTKKKLYIKDSNAANSTFKIQAANSTYYGLIVGDKSGATTKVTSVDNISGYSFTPFISTSIVPGTSITPSVTVTKSGGSTAALSFDLAGTTVANQNDTIIVKSKSNELGTKSLAMALTLQSQFLSTSPVVDSSPASLLLNNYIINNDTTGETTRYGNASCKYISKRLVLADGLDAEDVKVYLTAFKPYGTTINVYAKIHSATDGEPFEDKDWSLLDQVTTASLYSSSLNESDMHEYEYTFKMSPPTSTTAGKATAQSNTTLVGSGTTWSNTFTAGELIKVVKTSSSTDYEIIPISTVNSNTSITLASNISFTATGCTIEKITSPKSAFKYNKNSNIVRYYTSTKEAVDGYKYLAIKIVLGSSKSYVVPKVDDVRAIAVSV